MKQYTLVAMACVCWALIAPVFAADALDSLRQSLALEMKDAGLQDNYAAIAKLEEDTENGGYRVNVGTLVFYISKDGLVMRGNVLSLPEYQKADEEKRADLREALLKRINFDKAIEFKPVGKTCYTIAVFMDASCPFCAKLHQEIPALNQAGVLVRYLAYPKDGLASEGAKLTESMWCADKPQEAANAVWNDKEIPAKTCADSPLTAHFTLGESLDFPGTPTILFSNGEMSTGTFSAKELLAYLANEPSACQ